MQVSLGTSLDNRLLHDDLTFNGVADNNSSNVSRETTDKRCVRSKYKSTDQ